MKKLLTITTLSTIGLLAPARQVFAQVSFNTNIPTNLQGPTTSELVANVVTTLSFIAGIASVIAIIIGGIMYITSGGDEGRVRGAKNTLLYAIVGIVIAVSAYAISSFVVAQIK